MERNNMVSNDLENVEMSRDTIEEQNYINYISIPALESISIVIVATGLCKQFDIREKIWHYSLKFEPSGNTKCCITSRSTDQLENFNKVEKNIINKLHTLPLPNPLKAKLSNIIRPIILQILEWIRYDRKDIECIDSICWTTEGTIDKIKTLRHLIDKDSGQHIYSLYKVACLCCMEDSIRSLWSKFPERMQLFSKDLFCGERMYGKYENHLIAYWTSTINNEVSEFFNKIKSCDHKYIYNHNRSLYYNMFTLALSISNSLAVKYFWNKLTDVEISNNLAQWVKNAVCRRKDRHKYCSIPYQHTDKYADIMYFLLSKINNGQQKEVFQKDAYVILESLFLDWPWQRFLLPTLQVMWECIDEKIYVQLLSRIAQEIEVNKTTEKLFIELWYVSPVNLKNNFIQQMLDSIHYGTDVICNLLKVEDVKTIQVILKNTDIEQRKKIVVSSIKNSNFRKVIAGEKVFLLDKVMEGLSEFDIISIKESIAFNSEYELGREWICNNNWNMVDKFLNWAFTSQDRIDYFKEKLNKNDITYWLLLGRNYELVNKFIHWCFDSEQKINRFKQKFPKSKYEVFYVGAEDWCSFEKIIDWCFESQQAVNDFKSDMLLSWQMRGIIFKSIAFDYDFKFPDKLLNWCCHSNEEIKKYKAEFVFSEEWLDLLQRCVSRNEVYDSEWNNWELIRKLMKLFAPLEDDTISQLKEKITTYVNFDDFRPDYKNLSFNIKKTDLFRLMDDKSYNTGEDDSNTDSNSEDDSNTDSNSDND